MEIERQELVEMSELIIDIISIIPLLLGSVLMLASGTGFISSRYPVLIGLLSFMVSGFVGIIFKKKFMMKSGWLWRFHKNIKKK